MNEYKTKSDHKNITNGFRYFLESNFLGVNRLFVSVYTDKANNAKKINAQKHYLPKGIIKNYDVIINGKNIYDKAIDSDIKRYTEIGKLATGWSEDYTTGCLLDYEYIKNHHRLIAADLTKKKIDADPKANEQIEIVRQLKKNNRWWW